jgi:hypothetical protein
MSSILDHPDMSVVLASLPPLPEFKLGRYCDKRSQSVYITTNFIFDADNNIWRILHYKLEDIIFRFPISRSLENFEDNFDPV